jgi:hypothetical protein
MDQKKLAVGVFTLSLVGLAIFGILIFSRVFGWFYVSSTGCISSLAAFLPLAVGSSWYCLQRRKSLGLNAILIGIFFFGVCFSLYYQKIKLFSLLLSLAVFSLLTLLISKQKIELLKKEENVSLSIKEKVIFFSFVFLTIVLIPTFYLLLSELSIYYGTILIMLALIYAQKIKLMKGLFFLSLWGLIESGLYSFLELAGRGCPHYLIKQFWGVKLLGGTCPNILYFPTCFYSLILFLTLTTVMGIYLVGNRKR